MTVSTRPPVPEEIQAVNEPGLQIECDACSCDLTHAIRVKCDHPACEPGDGVDICPSCFCAGKEFGNHKRGHPYRVVELHSYPIFSEDWGADEELLLIEGISLQGLGNWKKIAEHIGTRTKEEVEEHYNSVYIDSPDWPLPRMDRTFTVDASEFQERKRRRIGIMNSTAPPAPKVSPTSAPAVHEIAGFLPGRLEFEEELDNPAEELVKDLEFGLCYQYGGGDLPEDKNDADVVARQKWEEQKKAGTIHSHPPSLPGKSVIFRGKGLLAVAHSEALNGNSPADAPQPPSQPPTTEIIRPPPVETNDSLVFKLTLIEMYNQRIDRRAENKAFIFNRGLLEYKKVQVAEKKRSKEEKDIINRLRPFARIMTAEDFEAFSTDRLYEAMLRERIKKLQYYRTVGLTTQGDIERYESDLVKHEAAKANLRGQSHSVRSVGRHSTGPDPRAGSVSSFIGEEEQDHDSTPSTAPAANPAVPRKPPAPLNLSNSPSLHLLSAAEQALCSSLRILPKPYLSIKETLVREYSRRGGKLRRREARDLVKIDVNKTSRVWDFLVQTGLLPIAAPSDVGATANAASATPSAAASPVKASAVPLVVPPMEPPPQTQLVQSTLP